MTAVQRLPELHIPAGGDASDRPIMGRALAVFTLLWLVSSAASQGFGPADGCMHYLFARFALNDPQNLVDVWARPLCTLYYAMPAVVGGRLGVCTFSWAAAVGCALLAYELARAQGLPRPALAFIFTLAQPLLFMHTLTVMTELPFALVLAAAFLAYERQHFNVAAALLALSPLARPEGFGFLLLAMVVFLFRGQWKSLLICPMGLVVWDVAGWLISNRHSHWWRWLVEQWPYASRSMYEHGNLLAFVAVLPVVVSPFLVPAMLLAVRARLALIGSWDRLSHQQWCRVWAATLPVLVVIGHSLLYAAGKMASDGEARYLLIMAPFWGLLSAEGWSLLSSALGWSAPVRWGIVAALAPAMFDLVCPVIPLRPPPDWHAARRFARWYRAAGAERGFPDIAAANPAVFYHLDLSPTGGKGVLEWKRSTLLVVTRGTLIVWDPICGNKNANPDRAVTLAELLNAGWMEDGAAEAVVNDASRDPPGEKVGAPGPWHILRAP